LRDAQNELYQALLQEQQWLLEENQHLEGPPTHLVDDYNGQVFLIGNFVKGAATWMFKDAHWTRKERVVCSWFAE